MPLFLCLWRLPVDDAPRTTTTHQTEDISTKGKRFDAFISRNDKFDRMLDTNGSLRSTVSTKRL